MEGVRIVELKPVETGLKYVVEGLPDTGLVGAIAVSYLVGKLNLEEVAYIESEALPPVVPVHKGLVNEPFRIYGGDDLLVVLSEIALPLTSLHQLSKALVDWYQRKSVGLVITITGMPVGNRLEIEKPKVFGVATDEETLKLIKGSGISVFKEGYLAGPYALTMRECSRRGLRSLAIISQSFLNYPDPGAAASSLEALSRLTGIRIDTTPLLEKSDEIRVKARDLMRQAQASMKRMGKPLEKEMPLMYG